MYLLERYNIFWTLPSLKSGADFHYVLLSQTLYFDMEVLNLNPDFEIIFKKTHITQFLRTSTQHYGGTGGFDQREGSMSRAAILS